MKAVRFHHYGDAAALVVDEMERPTPGPGEILVHVRAAGVNYLDCKIRAGLMRHVLDLPLPIVPGGEFAGRVEMVGADVTTVRPGDPVFGQVPAFVGGYAEWLVAKAHHVTPLPSSLSFAQAASLPISAGTAWLSVAGTAQVGAGQRILVHGAGGGVGGFAVQFARALGADVVATASARKAEMVRAWGAEVVEYDRTPFEQAVGKVDAVLDCVGGDSLDRCWSLVRPGGLLMSVAMPPDAEKAAAMGIRSAFPILKPDGARLARIGAMIDAGKVRTGALDLFGLDDAGEAHRLCETRHAPGRIVLAIHSDAETRPVTSDA